MKNTTPICGYLTPTHTFKCPPCVANHMSFTLECMNEALDNKHLEDTKEARSLDAFPVISTKSNPQNLSPTKTIVSDVRDAKNPVKTVVEIVDSMCKNWYFNDSTDTDLPHPTSDRWDEQIAAEICGLQDTFLKGIVNERKFHAECPADTVEATEIADNSDKYENTQEVEEDEIDAQANDLMVQVKSSESQARDVDTSDDSPVDIAVFPSEEEPCGWRGIVEKSLTHKKGKNTWEHLGLSE